MRPLHYPAVLGHFVWRDDCQTSWKKENEFLEWFEVFGSINILFLYLCNALWCKRCTHTHARARARIHMRTHTHARTHARRERERERERDGQTDRQAGRQADSQTDRQTDQERATEVVLSTALYVKTDTCVSNLQFFPVGGRVAVCALSTRRAYVARNSTVATPS